MIITSRFNRNKILNNIYKREMKVRKDYKVKYIRDITIYYIIYKIYK